MEIKNIKIYFLFLIIILFYNTYTFSTDLPKNYKEGVYTQSFKDNLLVAQNDNTDSKFYKSVVILLEHDEKGAFGFAVNKFLGEYPLSSLVSNNNNIKETDKKKLDKLTLPIYWGGPVDENRIFVLHTNEYKSKSTKIFNSLSVTNDLQILIDISENNGPKESLILIGISGWGENQLEGELERDQWSLAETELNLIFNADNKNKWNSALKKIFVPL